MSHRCPSPGAARGAGCARIEPVTPRRAPRSGAQARACGSRPIHHALGTPVARFVLEPGTRTHGHPFVERPRKSYSCAAACGRDYMLFSSPLAPAMAKSIGDLPAHAQLEKPSRSGGRPARERASGSWRRDRSCRAHDGTPGVFPARRPAGSLVLISDGSAARTETQRRKPTTNLAGWARSRAPEGACWRSGRARSRTGAVACSRDSMRTAASMGR